MRTAFLAQGLRISVSVLLLAAVLHLTGLLSAEGRSVFIAQLINADLAWLLISLLIGVVINMSSALKWWWLARAIGITVGYWRIFCYYVVGQFYNLFLPTSVGGDVVRAYELGKYAKQPAAAMASVFVERYTGIVTLFVFAILAFILQMAIFNVDFVVVSLVLFAGILGFSAWVVLDPRPYQWVRRFFATRWPRLETLFAKLDALVTSVDAYRQKPLALFGAFVNSGVFYVLAAINILISAWVFDPSMTWQHALAATPIIMLIMNIPISFGNLGLMEFAYASVFALLGFEPGLGLSVALLMRFKSVIDGSMGAALQPFFVTRTEN